jgi:hypothetical protein
VSNFRYGKVCSIEGTGAGSHRDRVNRNIRQGHLITTTNTLYLVSRGRAQLEAVCSVTKFIACAPAVWPFQMLHKI